MNPSTKRDLDLLPQEIAIEAAVADFEIALWQAMAEVIEDIPIQGCVFHWTQAIWRKVQSIELSTAYTSDQGTYDYVRRLMALPFIPQEHITAMLTRLQREATNKQLRELTDYINDQLIHSSIFTPEIWSIFM